MTDPGAASPRVFRTDRATFDRWARALPGLPLPAEMAPSEPAPGRPGAGRAGDDGVVIDLTAGPDPVAVPPVVAASLAVHGCADVAVVVRVEAPGGTTLAVFGALGALAAGLVRAPGHVEIGLYELSELVDRVLALVPAEPETGPAGVHHAAAAEGPGRPSWSVRVAVLGADAAVAGWEETLTAPASPRRRHELAQGLRLALTQSLE